MKQDVDKLKRAIWSGAASLKPLITWADPVALLGALAEVESSFGEWNVPRYERSYAAYTGHLYKYEQIDRFKVWGAWAACSYSSFQIMYPVACELGFDKEPWSRCPGDLNDDEVAIFFVVEYIKKRMLQRGVARIKDFADAYNTGYHRDRNVPVEYIQKFDLAYAGVVSRRGLKKEELHGRVVSKAE